MHLNSLRVPLFATFSLGSLLHPALAQGANPSSASLAPAASRPAAGIVEDKLLDGLPSFLKVVPGGLVEIGLDTEAVTAAACQVVSEAKPELATKLSPAKVTEAMRRMASSLGRRKVHVDTFLLAATPVRNAEYEAFVAERRKAGIKMRAPLDWWTIGRKDDFNQRLDDIRRSFPNTENAILLFWERHGHDLPYALRDDKGNPIHDLPVTYVSWRDANEYAARFGMRLPREIEWTRAARGDGTNVWPLAVPGDPTSDRFTSELLKKLQIYNSRDQTLKAVGTVQHSTGPYGHKDMFGHVWQLVADAGYRAINGPESFAGEWKRLQKDKTGSLLQAPPTWRDDRVIAKGGSFLSAGEPIQLMIDMRAPVRTDDVMMSLGFRLAKDLRPGFDYLYSLSRAGFNKGPFAIDQDVELSGQIGAERYELDANGFPTDYHAISLAPVTWLSHEKNADLQKLLDRSQMTPMLIGVLASSSNLVDPAVPAGLWSVLYRKEGLPREVVDAIKQGHRELSALAKSRPKTDGKDDKADGGDKDKKDDKKDKKGGWREVIARVGLTEKDVEPKEAADGNLKFVRIDGLEVPADRDCFLLHGNEGKVIAVVPATNAKPSVGGVVANTIAIDADSQGRSVARIRFVVPLSAANLKRVVDFDLRLAFDRPAPTADRPWRLPAK